MDEVIEVPDEADALGKIDERVIKHLPGQHDQSTHAGEPRGLSVEEDAWYENSHAKHFGLTKAGFGFILDRMSEQIVDRAHVVADPRESFAKYVLNTEGLPPGTKEYNPEGMDPSIARRTSGRLLEVMSGVFGGALVETLSTGEFPDEAWQYVESIIEPQITPVEVPTIGLQELGEWKHLPGQHDQTSHGRKKKTSLETSTVGQEYLINYDQFLKTLKWIADAGESLGRRRIPEGIADEHGTEYPQNVEFSDREQVQLLGALEHGLDITSKAGECYENAWHLMQAGQDVGLDFKYVEGYADSMGVFPVGHAWVEFNGKPIDITWSDDIRNPRRAKTPKALLARIIGNAKKNAYKGYAIPEDYAYRYQARNRTYGPIVYDENDPKGKHSILKTGKLPWLEE